MKKAFCALALLLLTSCSFFSGPEPLKFGEEKDSDITPDMMSKVSFNSVMAQVFQKKCVACHGSSSGVNLETFENARKFIREIEQAAVITRKMPKDPYPPLTQEEMLLLRTWIKAGGPEVPTSGDNDIPIPTEILEPTYDSIRAIILAPKCIVCHKPGGKAQNIPLVTKEDLLDSPLEIVIPGNPEESMIMIVFQEGARKPMPPKKSGITPLTQDQIDIIGTWIKNGAKD